MPSAAGDFSQNGAGSSCLLDPLRRLEISGLWRRWESKAGLAAPAIGTVNFLSSFPSPFKKQQFFSFPYLPLTDLMTKNDDKLQYQTDRVPFLEEQVRKIRENGKIISMDIEKLLLREDNKFDFVNEVAAEATSYIEANRDEYGFKKPILHALSNRMKEAGFDRPEAYMETDPYKPDPSYLRDLEI
ncbi:protein PLASTID TRANSCRIPTIONALLY ACTIVE 7-like isoform X1 [Zingiber officinale]|uniref:protein PLASTID TRANSCRIPTIONALLY ACTIVE 7-like isoform X1 n=1 Tax=Zingiber officinale TaxID=94328 RepID=UPI001C4B4954|nr:protein PLASTID TRANSCRIPTIONALLY ACTIVE 7-like isoform X1 [Zingiber officinale]